MHLNAPRRFTSRLIPILLLFALPVSASSPPSGSVSSTVGSSTMWNGTATGGTSADESTCVEGINCDTFTLTVGGVPTDWVGKQVSVKIEWNVPTNDYDLYIHQGSNAGPIVGSSAGGAPQTSERAAIDPGATGTGVYTVHVV